MSRTTPVGLADLALALNTLAPAAGDRQTRATIARLLGLQWQHLPEGRIPDERHGPPPGTEAPGTPSRAGHVTDQPEYAPDWVDDSVPIAIEPVESSNTAGWSERWVYEWLYENEGEEVASPATEPAAPPASPPLFRANWLRGILQAATSLTEASGKVDIEQLIRLSASRRATRHVPRLPRATLRHGVQVLLDRSRSMAPCLADQNALVQALARLFPGERLQVLEFLESPLSGVIAPDGHRSLRYRTPARPRVVLVVSDFGAAPPVADTPDTAPEEWLRFAEALAAAACPFVALSPYPRRLWHPALAARTGVITWDRGTTIADVARSRRRAR